MGCLRGATRRMAVMTTTVVPDGKLLGGGGGGLLLFCTMYIPYILWQPGDILR